MREFAIDQRLWDHADDFSLCLQYRIGDGPHESDRPATEHEADPGFCERRAEIASGVAIDGVETGIRTAEHTKPFHRPSNQGSSALAQSTC